MTERNGERRDHPVDEPAPAVTSKARSDEWVYTGRARRVKARGTDGTRRGDEPAPTLQAAGLSKGRDVIRPKKALRADGQKNATVRNEDESAPTIKAGHDTGERVWTEERPAPTIVTTRRPDQGIVVGRQLPEGEGRNVGGRNWGGPGPSVHERPATTVAGDPRLSSPNHHNHGEQNGNAVRVTEQEAAILQSFPPDYPFRGSRSKRFEQIGNAVPPLLAFRILEALLARAEDERKAT